MTKAATCGTWILCLIALSPADDTTTILHEQDTLRGYNFFHIGGGVHYQPVEELNEFLAGRGIESLSDRMASAAVGFYGRKRRHGGGLDFETIWSKPAESLSDTAELASVRIRGISLSLKHGFDLVSRPRFAFGPVLGIGYFRHSYDFRSPDPEFTEVLEGEIGRRVVIKERGMVLKGGVCVRASTFMRPDKPCREPECSTAGLYIEVGANYYPERLRRTRYERWRIGNGPDMSHYAVYARLSVILGGKETRKDKELEREIERKIKESLGQEDG